ncbi:MAG: transposase [Endozoicomonadaceae bacterium]|nr:transposase [Endozoicomonadaceae bacterium]
MKLSRDRKGLSKNLPRHQIHIDLSDEEKAEKLPKHPLAKVIASAGLLFFIIVSKYCDGLPLYRLENILKHYGGEISRTSITILVIKLALQLQPLIKLILYCPEKNRKTLCRRARHNVTHLDRKISTTTTTQQTVTK